MLEARTPDVDALEGLGFERLEQLLAEGAVQDLPHHLLLLGPQKREIQEHDLRHEEREDRGRLLGDLDGAEHRLLDLVAQAPQLLRGKDLDVVVALRCGPRRAA